MFDFDDGSSEPVVTNEGADSRPRWSPDGRGLAFLSTPLTHFGGLNDIVVLDMAGGSTRNMTGAFDRNESSFEWNRDGQSIVFEAGNGTLRTLYSVDVATTRIDPVFAEPFLTAGFDLSGSRIASIHSAPDAPPELWVRSTPGEGSAVWSEFNDFVEKRNLGMTEIVEWRSEGWRIEGLLVKPPDFDSGRRYPVIVDAHGGPFGAWVNSFHPDWQFYAANGFLVFAPNYRGSDNYGRRFL